MTYRNQLWLLAGAVIISCIPAQFASAYFQIGTDEWELQQKLDDVSRDLDRIKANQRSDATRRYFDTQMQLYKTLRSKGYEVYFPTSRDSAGKALCTGEHSSVLLDTYCVCDDGYAYSLQQSACLEKGALLRTTQAMIQGMDDTLQKQIASEGKGSLKACNAIIDASKLIVSAYNAAFEKSQNVDQFYLADLRASMDALAEYNELLTADYDAQCNSKAAEPATSAMPTVNVPDVEASAWYYPALAELVQNKFLNNWEPFRPGDLATRAELIRLVVELNGGILTEPPATAHFDDVPVLSADFAYFEEAAKEGWITGQGNCYGRHPCYAKPNGQVNRAEAAALMVRAFGIKAMSQTPSFEDVDGEAWYAETVRTAASKCLLQGDANARTVRPAGSMNRAEMVVMLWRVDRDLTYPDCSL